MLPLRAATAREQTALDRTYLGEILSTLTAVVWALAVVLFRRAGDFMPPLTLNLFKGWIGLSLAVATHLMTGGSWLPGSHPGEVRDALVLFVSGVIGIGMADTLFFVALNRLGASRLAIVDCSYSPFVMIFSFLMLGEPVTMWLPVAAVLMGLAIVAGTWEPRAFDPEAWKREKGGIAIATVAVALMAFAIVLVKPILDRSPIWWALSIRLGGGVSFLLALGILPRHRRNVLAALRPGRAWIPALFPAVLGTYLAIYLWTRGIQLTYVNIASVLNQLSNVFILPLAALILKERMQARHWLAVLLGVGAGAMVFL